MNFKNFVLALILLTEFSIVSNVNAQWQTSFTGPGSSIHLPYTFSVSVVDSNVIWANLARLDDPYSANEFLRTADGGQTWERGLTPVGSLPTYNIYLHAQDALRAWVVSVTVPAEDHSTIYKTIDGGNTWQEVDFPFSYDVVAVIAVHFLNPTDGFAYAETFDGTVWSVECYYSSDGGDTWELATAPYLAGERIFIWHGNNNYAVQGDTIWFGTSLSRVFRSIDKGHNWEAFSLPFYHTRPAESVAFQDSKKGIIATALSDSLGGTLAFNEALLTSDGGATWKHIPIPNDINLDPRLMGLCAIPGSNGVYMLNGYRQTDLKYQQMITSNNGVTWEYVAGGESKVRCMQFISPTQGWGGGWNYYQNAIIEKVFKWSGPPLIAGGTNKVKEWNELEASIELLPNPASEVLHLQVKGTNNSDYQIDIFDISGKQVSSTTQQGNVSKTLFIRNWKSGTYLVKISGANGMTSRTFIKQ